MKLLYTLQICQKKNIPVKAIDIFDIWVD